MPISSDVIIQDVEVSSESIDYRTPMKFGGRVVTEATLLNVRVTVETVSGHVAQGFGSMPMGNVWAWPTDEIENAITLKSMLEFGQFFADHVQAKADAAHPLQHMRDCHPYLEKTAESIRLDLVLPHAIPVLAQLVAASPIDAAIHDAFGKANQCNAYNTLGKEFISEDLSKFLGSDFQGEYLDKYTYRNPQTSMPLYHLVGALDPIDQEDLTSPIEDGLPETLIDWIRADGLQFLKIKLNGDDLAWDVQRVAKIDRIATETSPQTAWKYSLDFNEKCPNVEYVLDFLGKLREISTVALDRVQYIEQPTHRDLRAHPENKMHEAAKIKPVVIDESLVDLESLYLAQEQGYSGVALKACKGHSEALLMGAVAQKRNLFLCVQDLTCPGASFLHSASLAARIPTVAAIEGNGRQYCPAGNAGWSEEYPSMFDISNGQVGTGSLTKDGLGF